MPCVEFSLYSNLLQVIMAVSPKLSYQKTHTVLAGKKNKKQKTRVNSMWQQR